MTLKLILLILTSVSMSALAQISMKFGISAQHAALAESAGSKFETLFIMLTSPFVFAGLSLYAFGAMLWLFVLSRLDVSAAYPFVGLGFIFTMLLGAALLDENITLERGIGTLLVVAGVVLVAR